MFLFFQLTAHTGLWNDRELSDAPIQPNYAKRVMDGLEESVPDVPFLKDIKEIGAQRLGSGFPELTTVCIQNDYNYITWNGTYRAANLNCLLNFMNDGKIQ